MFYVSHLIHDSVSISPTCLHFREWPKPITFLLFLWAVLHLFMYPAHHEKHSCTANENQNEDFQYLETTHFLFSEYGGICAVFSTVKHSGKSETVCRAARVVRTVQNKHYSDFAYLLHICSIHAPHVVETKFRDCHIHI